MNVDLKFSDIRMNAYNALCGYENISSVVYNRFLSEAIELYKNNELGVLNWSNLNVDISPFVTDSAT